MKKEKTPSHEASWDEASWDEASSGGLFGRLRHGVAGLLSRTQVKVEIPPPLLDTDQETKILTFAYTPEIVSLYDLDGEPQLPQDLIPLCRLSYQEQVRLEAIEAIRSFSERDVKVKIFTRDDPKNVLELVKQSNLSEFESSALLRAGGIDVRELVALSPQEAAEAVKEHAVFGRISPQHGEQIVQLLRTAGHAVGYFGDGTNDVPAMRRADLSLTRRNSSPAALSTGDIILLNDSPLVLSRTVDKGQRIVNGLLDVLKLYLTQIFYLLLLIVGVPIVAQGFPYSSAQGGIVALLTLTIPAVVLSLRATGGTLPTASLKRVLARFVAPAALTMALVGLAVFVVFWQESGDVDYAQLAVTYALVFMGLLLVIYIKPPVKFSLRRPPLLGDPLPTVVVLISAVLFIVMTNIPLAQQVFDIEPLLLRSHYAFIAVVVLIWSIGLQLTWLVIPPLPPLSLPIRPRPRLATARNASREQGA